MKQPLVSVPVITYNSSKYIIDGLESIKAQTYENIELIISDDCSTDNTVELCREWLEENKTRFARVLLVTVEKNTGVAGNCNRAIAPCKGEWIKILSGDDKFLPYTIQGYMEYVISHSDCNICFAPFKFWGTDKKYINESKAFYEKLYKLIKADLKTQQKYILRKMFVPGPGIFFLKSLWEKVGGFDERYPFCEEDPFMNRVILGGNRIHFINKELYGYNFRLNSLSRDKMVVSKHLRDRIAYFFEERRNNMIKRGDILNAWDETITYHIIMSPNQSSIKKILHLISPLWYKNKLQSILK